MSHTFCIVRSKQANAGIGSGYYSYGHFEPGWYVSQSGVKPGLKNAKFFSSEAKARQFLKKSSKIVWNGTGGFDDYFEFIPINIEEP